LLSDVLRVGVGAEHAADGADHESLVPLDESLKCPVVTGADQSDKPNIFGILRSAAGRAGFRARHCK
jgi:hypothetical protein